MTEPIGRITCQSQYEILTAHIPGRRRGRVALQELSIVRIDMLQQCRVSENFVHCVV